MDTLKYMYINMYIKKILVNTLLHGFLTFHL